MGLLDPNSKPTDKSKIRITKGINTKTVNSPHKTEKVNIKTIDSKITKRIDRLENTEFLGNAYEFKLLFCGSRDGFKGEKFHEICDGQSRTVSNLKSDRCYPNKRLGVIWN